MSRDEKKREPPFPTLGTPAIARRYQEDEKPKGGRPPKYEGEKPWEKEGISKALWYRRRAKKESFTSSQPITKTPPLK